MTKPKDKFRDLLTPRTGFIQPLPAYENIKGSIPLSAREGYKPALPLTIRPNADAFLKIKSTGIGC